MYIAKVSASAAEAKATNYPLTAAFTAGVSGVSVGLVVVMEFAEFA